MAGCEIVALSGIVLDPGAGVLRDFTAAPEHRDAAYLANYDNTTLIYDAVWSAPDRAVVLTAPSFLNLWDPFRTTLRLDGQPVGRLKRLTGRASEQVVIPAPARPGQVSVEIGGRAYHLAVRDGLAARFRGLNTLLAMNRDNRLDWIADWARFHADRHGAKGVVIIDNDSRTYAPADLAACLEGVPGIRAAAVFHAPFRYGLTRHVQSPNEKSAKFLQRAMLNLARMDPCREARAVLSVDIDELVTGPAGRSVFDAAARHPLGMVTVRGRWAFPAPDRTPPLGHGAHRYRRADGKNKCNRKWCVAPGRLIGRHFLWDVHRVAYVLQNLFTERNPFELVHCRGTNTGWKRKDFEPPALVRDPGLDALMDRHFGPLAD